MLHPVGTQSSGTYWRRRILLIGAPLVLILVTAWVTLGGGGSKKAADPPPRTTPPAVTSPSATVPSTSPATKSSASSSSPSGSSAATSAAPAQCTATQLRVSAATGQSGYKVGDSPMLFLQVVNAGSKPCVQDLADRQVELRVYNGESRVWGSHDCKIEPGSSLRTLPVGQPVRISITWTGLSSQPGCGGTRQRVGAGTYTLYPYLSGRVGTVAQFSIT